MPKTRGLLLTSSFSLWTVTSVQLLLVAGFPQPCPSHHIVSSISFVIDKIVNNTILSFLLPQYEFSMRNRRKCHQIFCSPSFSRADIICSTLYFLAFISIAWSNQLFLDSGINDVLAIKNLTWNEVYAFWSHLHF